MGQFLIDNNIISNYFSHQFSEKGMNYIAEVFDQRPIISVITEIEALSWISSNKMKEKIVKSFIEDSNFLTLTHEIVKECVKIRRSRKIKTPDAIIAATALVHNLTLITSDKGFNNISNLKIFNPNSL